MYVNGTTGDASEHTKIYKHTPSKKKRVKRKRVMPVFYGLTLNLQGLIILLLMSL